jgi:hypothetical protein
MSKSSLDISVQKQELTARLTYELTVTNPDGSPAPGVDVYILLEGPGSIAPGFSAKDAHRETDKDGRVRVSWFRRGIYDRDISATLSVSCERDDLTLSLEALDPESANQGTWISWAPRRLKF